MDRNFFMVKGRHPEQTLIFFSIFLYFDHKLDLEKERIWSKCQGDNIPSVN